jgi:hypothetical protein
MTTPTIQTFYVSLTRDLLGYYLAIRADSEATVKAYLAHEYRRSGVWMLPWCAVYTAGDLTPEEIGCAILARCGILFAEQF